MDESKKQPLEGMGRIAVQAVLGMKLFGAEQIDGDDRYERYGYARLVSDIIDNPEHEELRQMIVDNKLEEAAETLVHLVPTVEEARQVHDESQKDSQAA